MAIVTGFTAARSLEIEQSAIISGRIVGDNLVLKTRAGNDIVAGSVRGPIGNTGLGGLTNNDITASVDFNTLLTPGIYTIRLNSYVQGSTNFPTYPGFTTGFAGFLFVQGTGTTGFTMQTWVNYNNASEVLSRSVYNGTWYSWKPPVENATSTQDGLMVSTDKSKLDAASSTSVNSTLVIRNSTGNYEAATPTTNLHVANKAYVDGKTPAASTTASGIVELADSTETQIGTDAVRAVTPAGLTSRTATDVRTGLVELATTAETQTGTDATRAVTPAGLASRTATDIRTGLVELATAVETKAGTDTTRAVTPAGLASLPGHRYLTTIVYTSNATFAKTSYPDMKLASITVVGGGGGGGGAAAASSGNHSAGAGGGGGGMVQRQILASEMLDSEAITVGLGGTAGTDSGGDGGNGGTSSFGNFAVAYGGIGGGVLNNNPSIVASLAGGGGSATGGLMSIFGSSGINGGGYQGFGLAGAGGSSAIGGGARASGTAAGSGSRSGLDGGKFGGGGSGGMVNSGGSAAVGGSGAPGVVIVELYA